MQWSLIYPDRVRHVFAIAAAPNLTAQKHRVHDVARNAILTDPDFHGGNYYQHKVVADARLADWRACWGTSPICPMMRWPTNSGRGLTFRAISITATNRIRNRVLFALSGDKFASYFDANTYLLMTKALDYFDPAHDFDGDLKPGIFPAPRQIFW